MAHTVRVFHHFYSTFLILATYVLVCPSAFGSELECHSLFQPVPASYGSVLLENVRNYGKDVVESKGARILLKPAQEKNEERWYGLLSKQRLNTKETWYGRFFDGIATFIPKKLGKLFSREDGYHFTPFVGIYRILVDRPAGYLTARYGNRRLETTYAVKVPAALAAAILISMPISAGYNLLFAAKEASVAHASEAGYRSAIENDYRYSPVKNALKKGTMSDEEALREAYRISLAYAEYFRHRNGSDTNPTVEENKKLLNHYLFIHLKNVIENGVGQFANLPGFRIQNTDSGLLSDGKIQELFMHTHQRYLKYQIVSEMVESSKLWQDIVSDPKLKSIVDSLLSDPFIAELKSLRNRGQITKNQMRLILQEDVHWQNKFLDWQTIGVVRLKMENGQYTDKPLTLADIREEMLAEVTKK